MERRRLPETKAQHYAEGLAVGSIGILLALSELPLNVQSIPAFALGIAFMFFGTKLAIRPITRNSQIS
jgi:hypothetical protein